MSCARVIAVILALNVLSTLWMINDQAFLKKRLKTTVFAFTGRELEVAGNLDLSLGRIVTIEAAGISLTDANWTGRDRMLEAERLRLQVCAGRARNESEVAVAIAVALLDGAARIAGLEALLTGSWKRHVHPLHAR